MRTIESIAYSYEDLIKPENAEIKQKVLEKNYDINVKESFWYEPTKDDFHNTLKIIGFWQIDSGFRGFSSQGDGACFTGKYRYEKGFLAKLKAEMPKETEFLALAERLQKLQQKCSYNMVCTIKQSGTYSHSGAMRFSFDSNNYDYKECVYKLEEEFEKVFREMADWYYRRLETEYDYFTSEEQILATIEANGYGFDEDGEMI